MAHTDYKITRVKDPAAPNRCQAVIATQGQCLNEAVPGTDHCPVHGGNSQAESKEKKQLYNYRLYKWGQRLQELGTSNHVKSLRDEVAVLRLLMEERLMKINDSTDLILQSGPISDLVLKIEKVVSSCHRLESLTGQVLDKQAVLQFANIVIDILNEELKSIPGYEVIINKIADRIVAATVKKPDQEAT